MILALFLLAGMADWVPARWISSDPKSLDLLEATGINCVLIEGGSAAGPFIARAGKLDIATVIVVRPGVAAIEQSRQAARLHASAIAMEGDFDSVVHDEIAKTGLPVIALPSRQKIKLDSSDPIVGSWQGLWPGIQIETHPGAARSGPTSNPWINTNTGFLQFLKASVAGVVWIGAQPPANTVIPADRYGIAVADAEAAGGRWIISLDDDFSKRLAAGEKSALKEWRGIGSYVQYFEGHREWRKYSPFSRMALIQDAASGGLLSASLLDLMFAQHVAARAAPASRLSTESLNTARTVIDLADSAHLDALQKQALDRFANSGGSLISPPAHWSFGADKPGSTTPSRLQLSRIQDIWEMLYNATARKNFGARTFNTAGILFNLLASPDNKRLLVHLVNYNDYVSDLITVQVLGDWKHARLYRPNAEAQDLAVYPVSEGTGVDLDKLEVTATVIFE